MRQAGVVHDASKHANDVGEVGASAAHQPQQRSNDFAERLGFHERLLLEPCGVVAGAELNA